MPVKLHSAVCCSIPALGLMNEPVAAIVIDPTINGDSEP